MEKKNKYPGFIEGFKASNLSVNTPTLISYSKQIKNNLSVLELRITNEEQKSQIRYATTLIDKIINSLDYHEQTSVYVIADFIQLGNTLEFIIRLNNNEDSQFNIMALDYLNIAKIIQDSRIDDLAVKIAESLHDTKINDNKR